jgi:aspartyl-tRNA(Asn)/glutamyl-tRNA(Gln) amidotransferase subunit C
MKIDSSTVEKIAHLSRLELFPAEKDAMIKDMNRILEFMDKLNEVDTDNVEPLIYLTNEVNVYRDDELNQEITVEQALSNAPKQDGRYFRVAKVINK